MGWLDFFKPEPTNVDCAPDVIWLTRVAKLIGIVNAIEAAGARDDSPSAIILVAHFPQCLRELQMLVDTVASKAPLLATTAGSLVAALHSTSMRNSVQGIDVIVGERHLLGAHDDQLIAAARTLPCKCRLAHHLSLDDALLRMFVGANTRETLRRLGMAEDEAINSRMVSRRLRGAQKKISQTAQSDLPADSAEDWLRRNVIPSKQAWIEQHLG